MKIVSVSSGISYISEQNEAHRLIVKRIN